MRYFLFASCLCLTATLSLGAAPGGSLTVGVPAFPKALIDYVAYDEITEAIDYYLFEPLITMSQRDYRPVGVLAERWRVSPDRRLFHFFLRPQARFSDERPVTAFDVKFTFDAIRDPRNQMEPYRALLDSFAECRVVNDHEVELVARRADYKNLEKLSQLFILPRHFFSALDLNQPFPQHVLGSGPYILQEVQIGNRIVLRRNPHYWGKTMAYQRGKFQLDRLVFKAIVDPQVRFEAFRRGDTDFHYFLISKIWATQTSDPLFQNHRIEKLTVPSRLPFGTSAIAWNLREPLFADRRVRRALGLLLNRARFIHELFYDAYAPSTGMLPADSPYHSPKVSPLPYDPVGARKLLAQAGWTNVGSDAVLIRDGKPFEFELLTKEPAAERFLTLYQQDLARMGIRMRIRIQDWASTLKRIDRRQFDAALINREREVEPSYFDVNWGSADADQPGSPNVGGFKNALLDDLAARLETTFDRTQRITLTRQIDELLAQEQPMTFLWEQRALRIGYWNRYQLLDRDSLIYARWYQLFDSWSLDQTKDRNLRSMFPVSR